MLDWIWWCKYNGKQGTFLNYFEYLVSGKNVFKLYLRKRENVVKTKMN